MKSFYYVLVMILVLVAGCGSTTFYQPGRFANFDPHPSFEIDDQDIAKAFLARPQLPKDIQVACYSLDSQTTFNMKDILKNQPGVKGVYDIPSLIVSGQRKYQPPVNSPLSMKKLRLLAARARCDMLVVFDYGYKITSSSNGLAALNALVLPVFFAPFLDIEVESYLDAFVIDTRNGYLYGHISSREHEHKEYSSIYEEADEILTQQKKDLTDQMHKSLTKLLVEQYSTSQAR